jgi:two-component system, chemotaxis family, chemotaxis protein CheV
MNAPQETLHLSSFEFPQPATSSHVDGLQTGETFEKFVAFWLENSLYCIPANNVLEVVHPLPVAPLPNSPAVISGIAAFRGDVVAVVDIRKAMGLAESVGGAGAKAKHVILRANANETQFAIHVDSMRELISIRRETIKADPKAAVEGLTKILEYESNVFHVIELDVLSRIVKENVG